MIHNMVGGGGGKIGAILTVSGDAGATVTVTKDGKTYTRIVSSDGIAVFKGLETGRWSLTMSKDGDVPVIDDVEIISDYSHFMTFFRSYISVTYPAGSTLTCTHTDGTVYTADTDTGSYTFVIKKPGTWTILSTNNIQSDSGSIEITESGQNESHTLKYFASYINVTAPSGSTLTCVNGSNSQVYTLGSEETEHTFTVFETGTYTITGMRGIETDSKTVEITVDEQNENITLQYFVAYINVTTKGASGSKDLSCSDGINAYNYTLSANGSYQFTVHNTGTWTITGTNSSQTKTSSVDVTTNGSIYNVILGFDIRLFDGGYVAPEAGGWANNSGSAGTLRCTHTGGNTQYYTRSYTYATNKVDLTDVKTIKMTTTGYYNNASFSGVNCTLYIGSSATSMSSSVGSSSAGAYSLDVSSLTGSYYVGISVGHNNTGTTYANVSKIICYF